MDKKSVIAIIEPMSCGRELIIQARKMGYEVLVFSANNGERTLAEKYACHVNHLQIVDTNNDALVLEQCCALSTVLNIKAVVPGFEYFVPLAAKLSDALKLPGLDPYKSEALRLKHLMRNKLVEHHLRAPAFVCADYETQFLSALENFNFPVVIKPVDGSGSMNVRRADNREEALSAFHQIASHEFIDMERRAIRKVLIEEYVSGPELSVDGYVDDGTTHIVSVTGKLLGEEPYFVEAGHMVEGHFSNEVRMEVIDYARKVVEVFGITIGPFHCELRQTPKGPVLMEIAARLPGDQICELIGYAKSTNIYEIALNCYLGIKNVVLKEEQNKFAGIRFIIRPGLRSFESVRGLENFINKPWTREITMYYKSGDIIPEVTDWLGRIGFGIFEAATYEELVTIMETFDQTIQFEQKRLAQ